MSPAAERTAPIGVFDSGMGGLTVLKALAERLPSEKVIYYGDTAHLPYGNKSPETVTGYSLAVARYLKGRGIKLLVVACNTASVYALGAIQAEVDIPVIGVVESGAAAAVSINPEKIGVIGTYGTVISGAYDKAIMDISPGVSIVSKACPLFVPLIEEGWIDHPVTRRVAGIYLEPLKGSVDSVILACTHYPLIKPLIEELLGSGITVIDSAVEVAKAVEKKIIQLGIEGEGPGFCEFCVSDAPELFSRRGPLFLQKETGRVKQVVL